MLAWITIQFRWLSLAMSIGTKITVEYWIDYNNLLIDLMARRIEQSSCKLHYQYDPNEILIRLKLQAIAKMKAFKWFNAIFSVGFKNTLHMWCVCLPGYFYNKSIKLYNKIKSYELVNWGDWIFTNYLHCTCAGVLWKIHKCTRKLKCD